MSGTEHHVIQRLRAAWPLAEEPASRVTQRLSAHPPRLHEQRSSQSDTRRHVRNAVQIPVLARTEQGSLAGHTLNISPGGLGIAVPVPMSAGSPLEISFCFGGSCYLRVSGHTVFCHADGQNPDRHILGVSFSAIRDWEQIILLSALKELGDSPQTCETSFVSVDLSRDGFALAAAELRNTTLPDSISFPSPSVESSGSTAHAPLHKHFPDHSAFPSIDVPTFPLLVNGQDLDTGLYKYCILADKLITSHRTVVHLLKRLKQGRPLPNTKDFVFAKYCVASRDTNLRAMRAAHAASKEYRFFSLRQRRRIASDIYELLWVHREALLDLMVKEGHPLRLAEWEFAGMEQAYSKESLDFYSQHLRMRLPPHGPESLYLLRKPDGVVGVCPPRNAPCSSSLIAGFALLAGNALIVKPPLRMPASTIFLWRSVVQAALDTNNAPAGTLNIVVGNSGVILEEWIEEDYVNDILFIGDSSTGLALGNRAFARGKKPILELSGNDMLFVWRDADLEKAVESLLDGFMGSTQICMVPKKAFIHEDVYHAFEGKFLQAVKSLKVGLPSDPEVLLSPVSKMSQFAEHLGDALEKGAELLCGGIRVDHKGLPREDGAFLTPAVLRVLDARNATDMKCVREENFFPLVPLIKITGREAGSAQHSRDRLVFRKMIAAANSNAYGLRVSVWVKASHYIQQFMEKIHTGGLLRINCRHVGFSRCLATHGGTGRSGGPFGELNYVWQKTSHMQGVAVTNNR